MSAYDRLADEAARANDCALEMERVNDRLRARVAALEAENAALREAAEAAGDDLSPLMQELLSNIECGEGGEFEASVLTLCLARLYRSRAEMRAEVQRWSDWHNAQVAAGRFEAREEAT